MEKVAKMKKEYIIIALTSVAVDVLHQQDALVAHSDSPPPPPLCQVVLPRVIKHVATNHPEMEVVHGCCVADFERQKRLVERAEVLLMVDAPATLLAQVIPLARNLRWIHSYLAGVDGLCAQLRQIPSVSDPSVPMSRSGLLVTNAKGVFSSSLKEYAIAAIMHFAKQIPKLEKNKLGKKWERFIMGEIKGLTVGFVGYGHIAREIASACKFFGMRCVAVRRDGSRKDELLDAVYSAGSKEQLEVYRQADFVVCSLPATPETENSVSTEQFAAMKKTGVFISLGRGCVVDETALLAALKCGDIAGAALDVFQKEPLPPDSPIWDAPNLLLSCHNADWCENYSADETIRIFEENLHKFLGGAKTNAEMATPIDCEKGY